MSEHHDVVRVPDCARPFVRIFRFRPGGMELQALRYAGEMLQMSAERLVAASPTIWDVASRTRLSPEFCSVTGSAQKEMRSQPFQRGFYRQRCFPGAASVQ